MIKVLHFYKTYYPDSFGGVEQVIFQISEGCAGYGVDTVVHTLSPHGDRELESFHSHMIVNSKTVVDIASTPFSISAIEKFRELLKEVDIIHYHFPYPFMDMLHLLCGVKKPTVVTYHSDILKQKFLLKLYKPLMYKFLDSVTTIVATSPNYLNTSDVLNRYSKKVKVIPIGIDEDKYPLPAASRVEFWKEKFPEPFFFFIGALRYYKGLSVLLSALVGTDINVVIAGVGPLEKELKDKTKTLGLEKVTFIGGVSDEDKAVLLKLSRGIVFPSYLKTEAFGITLIEGAMYSKPLISCEIGTGTSYININNETGFVVSPNDPISLNRALKELWDNEEKAIALGENARKRFESLFRAETMAREYYKIYDQLINN
ncbi:glycosyltransferase [Lonsdalea quercina]|uniref:glycosyltransferase n=1 Tax=Lonsdalea quercina TaxID=71657 RepID=UPI003974834B